MTIGDLGNLTRVAGLPTGNSDIRRLIGLPDFPAIATAATIVAKLRGLAEVGLPSGGLGGERLSMLALGLFVFSIDTIAFGELQRRTDWRHGSAERFRAAPAWQFLGPGGDTVTLPGVLMPGLVGDKAALDRLRAMAATGDAWPLVESSGTIMGQYIILAVDERRSNFLPGGAAKRIEFTIDLSRVDG